MTRDDQGSGSFVGAEEWQVGDMFSKALARDQPLMAVTAIRAVERNLRRRGGGRLTTLHTLAGTLHAYEISMRFSNEVQERLREELNRLPAPVSRSLLGALRRRFTPLFEADPYSNAERRRHDRDVRALKHLVARGIRADQVEAEAAKPGQGPEAWSRAFTASRARATGRSVDAAHGFSRTSSLPAKGMLQVVWTDANGCTWAADPIELAVDALGTPTEAIWGAVTTLSNRQAMYARRRAAVAASLTSDVVNTSED